MAVVAVSGKRGPGDQGLHLPPGVCWGNYQARGYAIDHTPVTAGHRSHLYLTTSSQSPGISPVILSTGARSQELDAVSLTTAPHWWLDRIKQTEIGSISCSLARHTKIREGFYTTTKSLNTANPGLLLKDSEFLARNFSIPWVCNTPSQIQFEYKTIQTLVPGAGI